MKKHLMSLLALVLGIGMAQAGPVGESQAKYVGQQFVQANFDTSRQNAELRLVYTGTTTRGEVGYYVFNVGEEGFVIVSGNDNYRPLVGYSTQGTFDVDNMSPECMFYLNSLAESRSVANANVIDPIVTAEWNSVKSTGRLISRNNGRAVNYLVQTQWNQSPAPYNSMCPVDAGSDGGHAYVGCVATAMAQIMNYWKYPTQGQGSHSYTCQPSGTYPGHPEYGTIYANFGATTYDYNTLNKYSANNYTQEQGDAVALIDYHCGVSVDMKYGNDADQGSGTSSEKVPNAIITYFGYSNAAVLTYKSNYTAWVNKLKESFDLGWPVLYSGNEPNAEAGHAFICDGYDDNDMFHFNFGWGGSGDGWFIIDGIDYTANVKGVFNFVPADIYNNTPQAPTVFNVIPAANNELAATVSWKNPSKTINNTNLTSIDRVVVVRDGEVIYTEDNVTPNAIMTITDHTVPRFDVFNYSVYAIVNGAHGKPAYKNMVSFGPTCNWTVQITKAAVNGFRGGYIHIYNTNGNEFISLTATNSSVQSLPVNMPLGHVTFGWSAPTTGSAFPMAFTIKNSQNQVAYAYDGNSADLPEGIFFDTINNCGSEYGMGVASNCVALLDEENPNIIHVSWDPIEGVSGYGYAVYRDSIYYRQVPNGTSFDDVNVSDGGHCYYVGYLYDGGENGLYSNESCATAGDCYAPTNIDYEYTSNYKIKLKWQKPNPSTGLSGYYLFRKYGENGSYKRVKLLNGSAVTYTDNTANVEGDYYYKLYAYYSDTDCTSAPASWIYDHNQFYLHAYYSTDGVDEMESGSVSVFPNPANRRFTVEGEGLEYVTVYNMVGQKVYEQSCQGESVDIELNVESGIYLVRVSTANGDVTKRITVIK